MKFKTISYVFLLLLVYSQLQAGTTDITRLTGYYVTGFNGGEFTIGQLDSNLQSYLNQYADVAKNRGNNPSFQSFCLELSEHTDSNVDYTIDNYAINGGAGADANLGGDPLSDPTAWLYKQFATGKINDYGPVVYDYDNNANRAISARGMQKAIWFLEEVINYDVEAKQFLDLYNKVVQNVDSSSWNSTAEYSVLRGYTNQQTGVAVFNPYVYGNNGEILHRQSQLILVPAPGAVILGSLGMVVVNYLRNRKRF